jgi:hypothetical protein
MKTIKNPDGLKTLALNFGLTAGALLFGVILGEIGLRIAKIEYPPPPRSHETPPVLPLYNFKHPYRGWAGNPGATAPWTGEGVQSQIKFNSGGFNDKERTKEKPANGFRIALMGDSFTEELYVPLELSYRAVVERELQSCPAFAGKQVEVLNFGVQGYSTSQALMTLRHDAWNYDPDMVILNFYAGNDIRNNYRPLEHDHLRPFFVYQDGKLVEDMSFRNLDPDYKDPYQTSLIDRLPIGWVRNSRILQMIRKSELEAKKKQFMKDYEEINIAFYKEPAPGSDWETAWKISEDLIKKFQGEVYKKGADFLLATISDSYQVLPNPQWQEDFKKIHGIQDLYYPDKRLAKLRETDGIQVYNLAGPIWLEAKKRNKCLHGFDNAFKCGGHWNEEGNEVAGQIIAKYICDKYTEKFRQSSQSPANTENTKK